MKLRIENRKMQTLYMEVNTIHQGDAKMDLKYWKQFESSGKIEDYLNFAARSGRAQREKAEQVERDSHAGAYICDRNCTEGFSGGRIR